MGVGRVRAESAASDLQNHDGLFPADALERFGQLLAVLVAFHVNADDLGSLVGLEVTDKVDKVDIGHVADGDELVVEHRHNAPRPFHQHRAGQRAALGDEGDASRCAEGGKRHAGIHERGVDQTAVIDNADAVGADHADVIFLRRFHQPLLPGDALFGLGLGVVCRGADDEFHVTLGLHAPIQIVHHVVDQAGWHDEHHEIHVLFNVGQRAVAGIPENFLLLRVDRKHLARVFLFPHVADRHIAGLPRVCRGAHHRDPVRIEQFVHILKSFLLGMLGTQCWSISPRSASSTMRPSSAAIRPP